MVKPKLIHKCFRKLSIMKQDLLEILLTLSKKMWFGVMEITKPHDGLLSNLLRRFKRILNAILLTL